MQAHAKMRNYWVLFVAFLAVLMTAGTVHAVGKSVEKSGMGFKYYEKVENPGTRSAGVRGVLLYQGHYLKPVAGDIKTPIGSFTYIESPLLFKPQGWFPTQDIIVTNTSEPISAEMLQKGQYKGALRVGTPDDWCYIAATDTWMAPKLLATSDRLNPFLLDDSLTTQPSSESTLSPAKPACLQKPERGPCKALMEVFYYDAGSRSCKPFFWGGCEGSAPFRTMEECQSVCEKSGNR